MELIQIVMKKIALLIMLITAVIFQTGCNKSLEDGPVTEGKGRLVVNITDDPFDFDLIESASITITKIEIRMKTEESEGEDDGDGESELEDDDSDEDEGDGDNEMDDEDSDDDDEENYDNDHGKNGGDDDEDGECADSSAFITLSDVPITVDLLTLQNGLVEELADLEIPAGTYDLIRLYVSEAELKLKDIDSTFNIKVPGGQQTGIKVFIEPELVVAGGLTSELLLDFDLSRSFVARGHMSHSGKFKGFIFKPVIRAVNMSTAGRVEGSVSDTAKVKIENAKVWVVKDSVVATSFSDQAGYYAIIGIPSGKYSVFAFKENFDTSRYDNVMVVSGNRTVVNLILKSGK